MSFSRVGLVLVTLVLLVLTVGPVLQLVTSALRAYDGWVNLLGVGGALVWVAVLLGFGQYVGAEWNRNP